MDFVISRGEGIVSIDNQPLAIDTSSAPVNVAMVAYDCSNGSGNVEYNDRLRLLEPFIDVSGYISFVNAWIAAASALTLPITLAQAKTVKIGLVDGIFNSQRQLPVTALNYAWDASDQSLLGMQSAIMAWDVAAAITTADSQFSNNVNAASFQTPVYSGVSASAITASVSNIPYSDDASPGHLATYNYGYYNGGNWVASPYFVDGVSGGGVTQQPSVGMLKPPIDVPPPIAGPPIDWPPLNSTVMVRLTMAQMRALVWNIQWRRTQLQTIRLSKTQTINSLSTVAAVIAYDVTSGWETAAAPPPGSGIITGGGVVGGIIGGGPGGLLLVNRAGPWATSSTVSFDGYTVAVPIDASALSMIDGGSKTKIVLKGTNYKFAKCYIGPRVPQTSGQTNDRYYTPNPDPGGLVQVTFNGQPGGTVAAIGGSAGILGSDEIAQAIDGTNGLVVYLVGVTSGGGTADWGPAPGFATWYASGDRALDPNRRPGGSAYTLWGNDAFAVYIVQGEYTAPIWLPLLPVLKFVQGSSGWGGYTIAVAIDNSMIAPTRAGDKTKISLQGYGPLTFDKCYIGPRSPNHPFGFEMVSSSQLSFGGLHGGTIATGQTLVSDELLQGIDGTNGLVVRLHVTAGGLSWAPAPNITTYWISGDSAALLTGGNWNVVNSYSYCVSQISAFYSS